MFCLSGWSLLWWIGVIFLFVSGTICLFCFHSFQKVKFVFGLCSLIWEGWHFQSFPSSWWRGMIHFRLWGTFTFVTIQIGIWVIKFRLGWLDWRSVRIKFSYWFSFWGSSLCLSSRVCLFVGDFTLVVSLAFCLFALASLGWVWNSAECRLFSYSQNFGQSFGLSQINFSMRALYLLSWLIVFALRATEA